MLASRVLLPQDRRATASLGEAVNISDYNSEARMPPDAVIFGQTIGAFLGLADGEVSVSGVIRDGMGPQTLHFAPHKTGKMLVRKCCALRSLEV